MLFWHKSRALMKSVKLSHKERNRGHPDKGKEKRVRDELPGKESEVREEQSRQKRADLGEWRKGRKERVVLIGEQLWGTQPSWHPITHPG